MNIFMKEYGNGKISLVNFIENISIAPIYLFCGSFVLYFYIKHKKFRKKPGDIFVMIAICDIYISFYRGITALNS